MRNAETAAIVVAFVLGLMCMVVVRDDRPDGSRAIAGAILAGSALIAWQLRK